MHVDNREAGVLGALVVVLVVPGGLAEVKQPERVRTRRILGDGLPAARTPMIAGATRRLMRRDRVAVQATRTRAMAMRRKNPSAVQERLRLKRTTAMLSTRRDPLLAEGQMKMMMAVQEAERAKRK